MSAPTIELPAVTEPGVYAMPDAYYHADPVPGGSLSRSGAKLLLPPSCPARFAYERGREPATKKEWDIGHAAHRLALGAGPDLVRIDADEWRSKAIKDEVAAVRKAGGVPLRPADYTAVHEMADALWQHPIARALFNPDHGKPEQTLVWRGHDVWLRCRLDWLPNPDSPGRMVIPDYKTADCADPDKFARDAARYSYHLQDAWYTAAVDNLLGAPPGFVFVVQEKTPPYLVTVVELDQQAKRAGHERMRRAIEIYRDCTESGIWPGYTQPDEIPLISLPAYATRDLEETW